MKRIDKKENVGQEDCYKQFKKAIQLGPTIACQCCYGLFFETSTKKFDRCNLEKKHGEKFVNSHIRPKSKESERMCRTCYEYVTQGEVPKLCFSNGFSFPTDSHFQPCPKSLRISLHWRKDLLQPESNS